MSIETEKATYDPDLPHAFQRGLSGNCQVCTEPANGVLHVNPAERAAHHEGVQTEKGS